MTIDKQKLHDACLLQQKKEVENFENRVVSLKKDLNTFNQSASQSEERSAGKMELLANYEKELNFSQMEMNQLQSLDPSKSNSMVEPGAIVITDQLNFYISIPTDKIEIDGDTFLGISIKAPIYAAMKGKKKGDTFQFNETTYKITDVS